MLTTILPDLPPDTQFVKVCLGSTRYVGGVGGVVEVEIRHPSFEPVHYDARVPRYVCDMAIAFREAESGDDTTRLLDQLAAACRNAFAYTPISMYDLTVAEELRVAIQAWEQARLRRSPA